MSTRRITLGRACALAAAIVLVDLPRATSAEPTSGSTRDSSPSIVVSLEYKELTNGYATTCALTAEALEGTPKLKPEIEKHDLGRYSARFKDAAPMAMVWDRTSNVLYLDLNRNLDLTDDPAGVITNEFDFTHYGSFKDVRLKVPTKEAEQPFLVDLTLFPLPVGSRVHISLDVRSLWHGKVTLDGTDCEIGIIDKPSRGSEPMRFLLRQWDQRDQPLSASGGASRIFVLPDELFYRGHLYTLSHRFDTNTSPAQCRLELKQTSAQLGEVEVAGKHIDRLLMTSGKRTVVLEQPAAVERIPVGSYMVENVTLKSGEHRAVTSSRLRRLESETVRVQTDGKATLVAGGPLTNSVSITRRGKTLVFNYELRGAGGGVYTLMGDSERVQPEFAVYQGERKIASGKFEFG